MDKVTQIMEQYGNQRTDMALHHIHAARHDAGSGPSNWHQVRSRCPSLVSLSGVVLVETRHTLVLQGEDGAKRRVPKAGSTFVLTLPAVDGGHPLTVHLRGEQLTRAAKA